MKRVNCRGPEILVLRQAQHEDFYFASQVTVVKVVLRLSLSKPEGASETVGSRA